AMLLGPDFRVLEANPACARLLGRPRGLLLGRDPIDLELAGDREISRAERNGFVADAQASMSGASASFQRRLMDGLGSERWFCMTISRNDDGPDHKRGASPAPWLLLWQEVTAEVQARGEARQAHDELACWFELSGTGMLAYDSSGLIHRCNAAFEALVEEVPATVHEAPPALRALLGFADGAGRQLLPTLVPGAPPVETQALVALADGRRRRLSARLACHAAESGERRIMAVVQDRSAEDDRDLAQLEMGVLMDTASIGVATYDPSRGWLAPGRHTSAGGAQQNSKPAAAGALQGIGRELVEPSSLPEFERLQRALRNGERTEVRYAVRHPELGLRWLSTRVEPGALSGGRSTTSVVTLDVTDQERAQRRNEQLLRELTTILDSSTAGIAYLRGPVLVRCNRRFERMLGFSAGAAAGATLEEIFSRTLSDVQGGPHGAQQALQALERGEAFEAELPLARGGAGTAMPGPNSQSGTNSPNALNALTAPHMPGGKQGGVPPQWYSFSVRRAHVEGGQVEAVAVLTDITRLKNQQAELEQLLRDRELMFSLSEVGIVYQRGARIERANQAMAELTGWASPELATLDAAELYEDTRACVAFEAQIGQALRDHGRFSGERLLRRRDGSLVWVQVAVRPVETALADAEAGGLICSFVDIDDRRRTRERLAEQADRTRAMLNSVLVGIVTVSERGIQWMNRSARRMFAGELADFVGEPMSIVATPEADHPLRRSDLWRTLPDGGSETFECRLRGRDGREFWVVGNAVTTGQAADGSRELTIALLDIERRRQAEVKIAQAQASLQRVIETAPLAIALFDATTLRVQQLNQTAASLFGRPVEQVLDAPLEAVCTPPMAAALRDWFEQAIRAGHVCQHEWREDGQGEQGRLATEGAEGNDGRVWDCRISPLDDAANSGVGGAQLLLVASDVTEQRAAERARLQAAIAQREVLVREVHHRIKNNLQGVAGLLQQNAVRHPELASVMSEAVGQVQAIAQVYGLQVGVSGPLQAAPLLRAIAMSVQRTFGRNIVVQAEGELPHLLPETEAIPVALTVNELLTNAIKHGSSSEVRLRLAAQGPALLISIANEGQLPAGFDVAQVRGGVSGLGLVRALLPRRTATLTLLQQGADVVAQVELRPPSVGLPQAAVAAVHVAQSAPA
ncbi:MAG TPA: PAS domain S-box protein, partial [Rubrivivax sp.]|nr:PAS domain S-box protein [Rubrivivax sp.]